ncbi:MAG: hypothetical protein II336_13105 [Loktanella sp.]|nr:hypothetical protein [Loktanella sp.]
MILRTALTVTLSGLAAQVMAQDVPPPIEPETLTVEEAIAPGPNLFAIDSSWSGVSNIFIVGADDLSMKGNVSPGMQALMVLNAAGTTVFSASNYLERIAYGPRTSIVHEFDVETASITREIEIPAKIAMVEVQPGLMSLVDDEKYLLVQNATPATSVTVVDLEAGDVLAEIPTPGCWIIIPAVTGPKFTTICGDGTFASFTFDADGSFGDPAKSEVIFDPDGDALFTNGARVGEMMVFASYEGNLFVVDDSGDVPVLTETIAMTDGIDGNFAPTGSELITYHEGTGVLFVLMHGDAYDGSHKDDSTEIWAYDFAARELLYRSNSNGENSLLMAQTETPRLYGAGGNAIYVYDIDPAARSAARLVDSFDGIGSISMMATAE